MEDYQVKTLDELEIESEEEWFDAPEENDQIVTSIQHSYVTVLKEQDIRRRMENEIQSVSVVFSISKAEAILVLSHSRWDVSEFHKKWSDDAKSVRESVGLLVTDAPSDDKDKRFFCGVCSKLHPLKKSASVSCGHRVCISCWTSHITNIIDKMPASDDWYQTLKCPYEYCPASVGQDMIERFSSEKEKSKYDRFLFRSYVDDSKMMKCCPVPGSSCTIDLSSPESGNSDVFCLCLLSFCWNCSNDAHSPVDCKTAANWVLANTVPCPKCKTSIKVNEDCSLKMTCLPPCNYDFCRNCRGELTGHGDETGWDLYTCYFHVAVEETDQCRKMAESSADRYNDCYENWTSNELLMQKAKAYLKQLHTDIIPNLSNIQLPTVPQLEFIAEAWSQIMECRRVRKWTYAYEYYLREDEVEKRAFLKHKQENNLQTFLHADGPSEDFDKFSINLTSLTSITRNHYKGLIRDLEEGLTNVVPVSRSQRAQSEDASGSGRNHDD
ncbi:hypothetical protein EUTSA_v10009394mg [Eutrema salsugineum]|uniref:RBR-type E3 ubiquitin transferase n=1 Tax=Eutrema salsugineum TaxID=72664 RepID=V4KY99_EUTSA|nr:hypothetical protein EUTSA_v10009394mg [Eutrema salsugineum]